MNVKNDVAKILIQLGCNPAVLGYEYTKTAVSIVFENKEDWRQITKVLYPTIAKAHKTTPTKVEWAIRHALDTVYRTGNKELLDKILPMCRRRREKPMNSAFLAALAEYIKIQEGENDEK